MSSLHFPWLSDDEKMLSSKVESIFLFPCYSHLHNIRSTSNYYNAYLVFSCWSSGWIFLSSCLCWCLLLWLWEVETAPPLPQEDKFACLPLQHWRRRVPSKAQPLLARQKGSVFSLGLVWLHTNPHIMLLLVYRCYSNVLVSVWSLEGFSGTSTIYNKIKYFAAVGKWPKIFLLQ